MNIAVIGAGLGGLVVGRGAAARGNAIRVFESEQRAGGQLHTVREHGFVVEYGGPFNAHSSRYARSARFTLSSPM